MTNAAPMPIIAAIGSGFKSPCIVTIVPEEKNDCGELQRLLSDKALAEFRENNVNLFRKTTNRFREWLRDLTNA